MEIRINFFYGKQFQQMTAFPQQQKELYNSASATLYKLWPQIYFFHPRLY